MGELLLPDAVVTMITSSVAEKAALCTLPLPNEISQH
jgi:hypothetical protein